MAPMISLADTDGSATNLGFESLSMRAALAFSFSDWTSASNLDAAMWDSKTTGHRSNGKRLNTEEAAKYAHHELVKNICKSIFVYTHT